MAINQFNRSGNNSYSNSFSSWHSMCRMTAKQVCLALNVRGNRRQNRRDPSFSVRVAVIAVPTSRGIGIQELELFALTDPLPSLLATRTNREPGGKEVPTN